MALTAQHLNNSRLCNQRCENLLEYAGREDLTDDARDILSDTEDLWEECQEQLKEIR